MDIGGKGKGEGKEIKKGVGVNPARQVVMPPTLPDGASSNDQNEQ